MAIAIKDTGALAQKFVRRAEGAVQDFALGIASPRRSQSAEAIAAAPRWLAAVTAPAAEARFIQKLTAAGDTKWATNSKVKGVDQGRFAGGVRVAGPAWQAGAAPVLDALRNLSLPARGLKRSPQNFERVRIVAETAAKAAGKA